MIPYFVIGQFKIGPLTIYTWGFFVALAFLVGLILAIKSGKKYGIQANKILYLVIFIYFGALIGARLLYFLQGPKDFLADPLQFFNFSQGGMMFYGGLFGGAAAGFLYIKNLPNRWRLIDALAPIIALTMAIGRLGCFLNNDHMGAITSLPWAIRWSDGTLRHPVTLYLILFDLALAGFLWWYRKYAKWPGQIFLLFLILYSIGRFLLDFTRDISADPHYLSLASSQWLSVLLSIIAVIYYIICKSKFFLFSKDTNSQD